MVAILGDPPPYVMEVTSHDLRSVEMKMIGTSDSSSGKPPTMVLKIPSHQVAGATPLPHPFDPLSAYEIERAASVVTKEHGPLLFNAVAALEPRKAEMLHWLADPEHFPRPRRVADVVATAKGSKVYDGLVDLEEEKIIKWEYTAGVQPIV